jgi:polyhydroxyalkanoate synthesis regulator phasin
MKEQLKNALLGGLGLTVLLKDAVTEGAKGLVEIGKLNEEEVKKLGEDIKNYVQNKVHEMAKAAEERTRPAKKEETKVSDTKTKKDKTKSKP